MSEQRDSQTPASPAPLGQAERLARRAQARRRQRNRRLVAAGAGSAVALVVVLVLALAGGSGGKGQKTATRRAKPVAPLPAGGPLAPTWAGGLAALWAPANVVGSQPGTAAAYEAAARRTGLPGYLMIADRGNNRILVVDPAGHVVWRYPQPGDHKLFFDDDTFVEPGGQYVIANEEDNHAIVQIGLRDASLSVLFGHPGEPGSDSTHVNTPDDAYMLPDGTFTVADASNCRILFIAGGRIVRRYGQATLCHHDPPHSFTSVNGDTPVPGGGVMVSEIEGNWIDEIGPEGSLRWSIQAPVSYPSDPQPLPGGRILLADYTSPGHILIMDRHGTILWRYGPSSGYGRLDHPSLAMALPNGDVAVNDDYRHRILIVDPRTSRIVWKYGHTDIGSAAPGHLDTPDGMDFIPVAPDGSPDYAAVVHP